MIIKFLVASFVIGIIIFLVTSISKNSIYIDKDELLLKTKSKDIYVLGLFVSKDEDASQEYLSVSKYTFKTNASTKILYEHITIDADRVFNHSLTSNVEFLFDAKDMDVLYKDSDSLVMAQLKLPDNTYINLIAESSNDTDLNIVYGFLNDEFMSLLKEVSKDDTLDLKREAKTPTIHKTTWDDKKFLMDEFSMSVTE